MILINVCDRSLSHSTMRLSRRQVASWALATAERSLPLPPKIVARLGSKTAVAHAPPGHRADRCPAHHDAFIQDVQQLTLVVRTVGLGQRFGELIEPVSASLRPAAPVELVELLTAGQVRSPGREVGDGRSRRGSIRAYRYVTLTRSGTHDQHIFGAVATSSGFTAAGWVSWRRRSRTSALALSTRTWSKCWPGRSIGLTTWRTRWPAPRRRSQAGAAPPARPGVRRR